VDIPEDEELEIKAQDMNLDIVHEDKDIVIINKKAGVVVHPAPGHYENTLVNGLLYHIKDLSAINGVNRPGIVHRLDKDTSGLIIVAKNDEAHRNLVEMFSKHTINKTYLAIAKGKLSQETGRIETLIGRNPKDRKQMTVVYRNGKNAITNYKVLDSKGNYTLLSVNIETGRTHQIRVHLKYMNHPIVGDQVYGRKDNIANRQMLHAYKLEFKHPITEEKMSVVGNPPKDFIDVIKKLDLKFDFTKKS
jgi:23S rRNA pseudouridine1911/1915/1917 synthase